MLVVIDQEKEMSSVHVHRFPCGTVAIETTREVGGISIMECAGPLPSKFRASCGLIMHPDPPDGGGSDAGFREVLGVLQVASEKDAPAIIAGAVK